MKIAKAIATSGALAPLLLAGLAGPALANGVGDLYVASPAGVLEVRVSTSTIVSTTSVLPSPQSLAFTPDGKTLYVGSGGAHITPIDIETLTVGDAISTPGPVTALAFPAGEILVGAMPLRRTLAFITVHDNSVVESAELPGPGQSACGRSARPASGRRRRRRDLARRRGSGHLHRQEDDRGGRDPGPGDRSPERRRPGGHGQSRTPCFESISRP